MIFVFRRIAQQLATKQICKTEQPNSVVFDLSWEIVYAPVTRVNDKVK